LNSQFRLSTRVAVVAALVLVGFGARARADSADSFMVGVLGGVGGSPDVKPGQSYGNPGFQIDLGYFTEPQQLVAVHLGSLDLSSKPTFGSLDNAKLTYANIGGEYRFQESYYESGIFIGLGAYRLNGNGANGGSTSTTAVGGAFGITGEFKFTKQFGFLVEFSAHYVDFRDQHVFVMGHGGLSFHF
jgi:hypothetical protein